MTSVRPANPAADSGSGGLQPSCPAIMLANGQKDVGNPTNVSWSDARKNRGITQDGLDEDNLNDARASRTALEKTANLSRRALELKKQRLVPRPAWGAGQSLFFSAPWRGFSEQCWFSAPFFAPADVSCEDTMTKHPVIVHYILT